LVAAHPGERIACVAHGGVLDCVRRFACRLPLDAPRDYQLLNTSLNVVDFDHGAATIVSWADIAHLDAPAADDGFRKVLEPGR
jgi:probable phosphoglycerate mutase